MLQFKLGVGELTLDAGRGDLNQAMILGPSSGRVFMFGDGGANDVHAITPVDELALSGMGVQNQYLGEADVGSALLESLDGTYNQFVAPFAGALFMTGQNSGQHEKLHNDATVYGNVSHLASEGVGTVSQAQVFGSSKAFASQGNNNLDAITIFENLNMGYLSGQGNETRLNTYGKINELGIDGDALKNNVSAEGGIRRLGLTGNGTQNEIFSFAGEAETEAVFQGTGNEVMYGGTGQQTVRIGGRGNTLNINTSMVNLQMDETGAPMGERLTNQHDTLELGGSSNQGVADLGVGNDTVVVHNNATNQNNRYLVAGGDGQDTLILTGAKEDWIAQRSEAAPGAMEYTSKSTGQKIIAADIESVRIVPEIKPGSVGFQENAGESL